MSDLLMTYTITFLLDKRYFFKTIAKWKNIQ